MTNIAPTIVILGVEGRAQQLDQRPIGAALALDLQADLVFALGLHDAIGLLQLSQALALTPVELLAVALLLVALGKLEQLGVTLLEANPLTGALKEAKIAAAALPPLVVGR